MLHLHELSHKVTVHVCYKKKCSDDPRVKVHISIFYIVKVILSDSNSDSSLLNIMPVTLVSMTRAESRSQRNGLFEDSLIWDVEDRQCWCFYTLSLLIMGIWLYIWWTYIQLLKKLLWKSSTVISKWCWLRNINKKGTSYAPEGNSFVTG